MHTCMSPTASGSQQRRSGPDLHHYGGAAGAQLGCTRVVQSRANPKALRLRLWLQRTGRQAQTRRVLQLVVHVWLGRRGRDVGGVLDASLSAYIHTYGASKHGSAREQHFDFSVCRTRRAHNGREIGTLHGRISSLLPLEHTFPRSLSTWTLRRFVFPLTTLTRPPQHFIPSLWFFDSLTLLVHV